jgi:curved DNA-binding protein CbpA
MPSVFDEELRQAARVFTDALNVLNISKDTSNTDARRAYFKLARVHHPDKGGSTAMFQRVKTAYDHVTNDAIRQYAQRAFDYIERQAQRDAREAQREARAEEAVRRAQRKRKPDDTLEDLLASVMAECDKLNAKRQKTTTSTPTRYRYADTSTSTPATRQPVLPTRQPKPIRKMSPTQRATKRARRLARAARRAARDARRATSYIRVQHRAQLRAT